MITNDDYTRALETFVSVAGQLGDKLRSILLYGSMVKGTVRPGASDMLDAAVILRESVLTTEAEYYEVLDVLTEACARIRMPGVPFHPVHYFVLDDAGWSAATHFLPAWKSERYSRIVAGVDLRACLRTADVECEFMRGWYVQLSWALQQAALAVKLGPRTAGQPAPSLRELRHRLRETSAFACFACGMLVDRDDAPAALVRLLPEAQLELLPQLCDRSAVDGDDEDHTVLVDQILTVNEELHRAVGGRMLDRRSPTGEAPAHAG